MGRDEFTHGTLVDGGCHAVALKDNRITISRFGIFSYYQISASHASGYRISAQPRPEIRLMFVSKGRDIRIGNEEEMKAFTAGESNCSLVAGGCTQDVAIHGDGTNELFMLIVGLSDIPPPIADSQPYLHDFLEAATCTWLLKGQNILLGIKKIAVIQQILHEKKPAYLQAAYMQLKLGELFVLFLEKADCFAGKGALVQLRPEELERIRKVRNMLHDNPAADYSLVGLAHAVGTNETSLKNNFKAVYGITVFGYLTSCRMERAKALLVKEKLKVALVAQEVGYKYASHFSGAFRKYFGCLPTKMLRVLVSVPAYLSSMAGPEVCTCLAVL